MKSLREWSNSSLFGSGKSRVTHDRAFGLGTNAKKDRERGQMAVYWFAAERRNGNSG